MFVRCKACETGGSTTVFTARHPPRRNAWAIRRMAASRSRKNERPTTSDHMPVVARRNSPSRWMSRSNCSSVGPVLLAVVLDDHPPAAGTPESPRPMKRPWASWTSTLTSGSGSPASSDRQPEQVYSGRDSAPGRISSTAMAACRLAPTAELINPYSSSCASAQPRAVRREGSRTNGLQDERHRRQLPSRSRDSIGAELTEHGRGVDDGQLRLAPPHGRAGQRARDPPRRSGAVAAEGTIVPDVDRFVT